LFILIIRLILSEILELKNKEEKEKLVLAVRKFENSFE